MLWNDVAEDPRLGAKRNQLVTNAVGRLVAARMVNWNKSTGALQVTDLGRIAAKYYIRLASIEVFNQRFRTRMSEADVLTMLCYSTEVGSFRLFASACLLTLLCIQFNQVQLRESEIKELEVLKKKVPCEVQVMRHLFLDSPPLTRDSGRNIDLSRKGQHIAPVLYFATPRGGFCSHFGPGIHCAKRGEDYPRAV